MRFEGPADTLNKSCWPTVKLSTLVTKIRSGATPKGGAESYLDARAQYVLVRSQNVFDHRFDETGLANISNQQARDLAGAELRSDDVLLNITGDGVTFGRACLVPKRVLPACVNQHVMLIRTNHALCRPGYLAAWLALPSTKAYIESFNAGGSRRAITKGHIESFEVPLPPTNIQRSIGELATKINDRIALLDQTNTTLESIARALFKSWFIDFDPVRAKAEGREPEGMDAATAALYPAEFEESELGVIPKGWHLATVGEIASVIDCLHSKKPTLLPAGRPFLQLSNIRDDGLLDASALSFISEDDYKKWTSRIEVREGDCVITNVGRVGAVAQVPTGMAAAMGRNMTAIRLRLEYPYPSFLIELLQSSLMRAEIERRTDVGTILDALNVRSIPLLRFTCPPTAILRAAEGMLRPLRASMELNLKRAGSLALVRDTLLPRLISGKLRLPEAQEQLEDALV